MALIVEDGSIVSGANSYITESQLDTYATARGIDLVHDEEVLVLKAMDYFESFSGQFKGSLVSRDQPLCFPRSNIEVEGWYWSSSEIPRQVINAVLALCLEINDGEDPFNPSPADRPITRERIEGAIDVQYASSYDQPLKVAKTQASRTHINLLLKASGLFAVRA